MKIKRPLISSVLGISGIIGSSLLGTWGNSLTTPNAAFEGRFLDYDENDNSSDWNSLATKLSRQDYKVNKFSGLKGIKE